MTKKYDNDYYYYIFYNKHTHGKKVLMIPKNKLLASKERFGRKISYNSYQWYWWITLTFSDKTNIEYEIDNMKFTPTWDINQVSEFGHSAYMRQFFNKIKTHLTKKFIQNYVSDLEFDNGLYYQPYPLLSWSYFWIYEQGTKTNRPHFHAGLNDIGIENVMELREFLFDKWKAGNVSVEKIEFNQDKIANYIRKYIKKEHSNHEKFTGKRFWGTSRNIHTPPKNPDIIYVGYANSLAVAHYIRENALDFINGALQIDMTQILNKISKWRQSKWDDIQKWAEGLQWKREPEYWDYLDYIDYEEGLIWNQMPIINTRTNSPIEFV